MRRLGLRLLMVGVGLSVLAVYALAAGAAYWVLAAFWANRPPLVTSVGIVAGLTLFFGYLNYQFGTTRLLGSLDAAEIARPEAPGLYDRLDAVAERMGIDTPRVFVADMAVPNAMSLGGVAGGPRARDLSAGRAHRPVCSARSPATGRLPWSPSGSPSSSW
jgi:heat shock protein HtpX